MAENDLDYCKIIGRIGLMVGDGTDSGENPDLIFPDPGATVEFEPTQKFAKADGASPPITLGQATIVCSIDPQGYLTYPQATTDTNGVTTYGDGRVWLVDLGSPKVNPVIPRDKAAYKVTYKNVKFNGTKVDFPSFTFHPLPGVDNDLTLLAPVPVGGGQAIVVGPRGTSIQSLSVSGGDLVTTFTDGSTQNAGPLPVGPGGSNAGVASYITDAGATKNAVNARFGPQTGAAGVGDLAGTFIANGADNVIASVVERDQIPKNSTAEGRACRVHEYGSHVEGVTSIADGKITHAEGNACICSGNDSHAEGNRTSAGRRYYRPVNAGSEDAGDGLGVLEYVVIPDRYGDVTSHFPNKLTDNITGRYGAGASKDAMGNIYGPTNTGTWVPATFNPDGTVNQKNDLTWAMHSICFLRGGPSETAVGFARIAKATYTAGVGTKVYYLGTHPGATMQGYGIGSSYSPVVLGGGNGIHAEGYVSSAQGYGASVGGFTCAAWGEGAVANGRESEALAAYSYANGMRNRALGRYSRATGLEAVSTRENQQAHASGKRLVEGDSQETRIVYQKSVTGAGWHEVNILLGATPGSYYFDTKVHAIQTGGTAGNTAWDFAYRFFGLLTVGTDGTVIVSNGPVTRTLVGRTNGMTGDGLTTGPRMTFFATPYADGSIKSRLILRFDSLADTTWWVKSTSEVSELLR